MSDTEIAAIGPVVATLQHAQQNELPEEFVDLFREDAIWTTGHGHRLADRAGRWLIVVGQNTIVLDGS
jgi:hypothetical protein